MNSIKFKLAAIGLIPIVLFVFLIMFYLIPVIKNSIYQEKKIQTREMTNTALGVLDHYHQLEQKGDLTRQKAQDRALQIIKSMTFGNERQDYFWINDTEPLMIMHPFRPDLEGRNLAGIQDPEGIYIFREFVAKVQDKGSGYVSYHWQYYDDPERIEPKLSYVAEFEPWQWIVGTGVYVNDVNETAAQIRGSALLWTLLFVMIILPVVFIFILSILRPLLKAVFFADMVSAGNLDERLEIKSNDEIKFLSDSLNKMVTKLRDMVRKEQAISAKAREQTKKAEQAARVAESARRQTEAARVKTHQALQALQESDEKLNTLFESMTEMVVLHELIFDQKGNAVDYRIIDCNKAFTQISGLNKEDIIGKPATLVYQSDDPPYLKKYSGVALSGEPHHFEDYYAPMDKYFSISVVSPGTNRFATIATDITATKKMQQMIAAKNKELEQVVYIASHDLRSPLVNIDGYSRELKYSLKDLAMILDQEHTAMEELRAALKTPMEDMADALHYIRSSSTQMDALLKGLLKLSRTGRANLSIEALDMNKILAEVIEAMEFQIKESGAEVHVDYLPPCRGDQIQVNQIFSNLVGNALKFLDSSRKGLIRISGQIKDGRCVYCVKDNGIGIDPAHQKNIFEVFHRLDPSKHEGEGLGLTIVRQVLERLGGDIRVKSEPGLGSSFFVTLPTVYDK